MLMAMKQLMVEEVMQMKFDDDEEDEDGESYYSNCTFHTSNVHMLQLTVLHLSFLISAANLLFVTEQESFDSDSSVTSCY